MRCHQRLARLQRLGPGFVTRSNSISRPPAPRLPRFDALCRETREAGSRYAKVQCALF